MKKRIKNVGLALSLGLFSLTGFSQTQVGNSDFEAWENVGTNDVEPTNWNSFMSGNCSITIPFACSSAKTKRIDQSTDAHSGTYSAKIWSTATLGIIANGNMTLGQVQIGSTTANDSTKNHNKTIRSNSEHNQPFTGKPDSLVVWVKFTPVTATDSARISATIHGDYDYQDPENANSSSHVVAKAVLNYAKTNGWQRLSIPFSYSNPAGQPYPSTTPAYILITFTTNKTPGGGKENDEVLIDDLEMIYNPSVAIAPTAVQNIAENTNGTQLTATETNGTSTSKEWKYTTTSGSGYVSFSPAQTGATYTPNFATAGTYYVVCTADFNGTVKTSNEVQINVTAVAAPSVSIAPTADQNIKEGQAGTPLTATETNGTSTSKEWKYTTTSGSGYVSFSPAQTGATYTPNFATQGVYYVICEATFGTDVVKSNEVKITVTEEVGVENALANNISVFGFDKVVTVDLTNITVENASVSIFDMAGKKIVSSALIQNSVNTIALPTSTATGIYMYQIEGKGVIKTGKLAF